MARQATGLRLRTPVLAVCAVLAYLASAGCQHGEATAKPQVVARASPHAEPALPTTDGTRHSTPAAGTASSLSGTRPTQPSSPPPVRPVRLVFSAADRVAFAQLQGSLPGPAGIAVSGIGRGQPVAALGALQAGIAWSTSKVPVVMAALAAGTAHAEDVHQALRASDNEAAMRIWRSLGNSDQAAAAATAELRAVGDADTVIQPRVLAPGYTPFGQTVWSLGGQVRFMAGLSCTSVGRETVEEMRHVIAAQRWGVGTVDPTAAFKGGWGPGTLPGARGPWIDRQMGLVSVAGKPVAIAIAVQVPGGSHTAGAAALSRLAAWAVAHAHVDALPAAAGCG